MYFLIFLVGVSSAIIVETNKNIYNDIPSSGFVRGDQRVSHHPRRPHPFYYKDTYVYPRYEFDYTVSDKKTGDHKYHHEERDGPRVRGEYGLVEPDGSLRKVEYHADDHNGFNAVVSKSLQKHGDHAFSTMGHTRHFLPTGNEINTNHYFPRKYEYKPEVINDIKPVNDLEITANMAEDMNRDISETDNKEVITLNKNQQNSVETTTFSVRTMEATDVSTKILPTTMSMNIEDVQPNNENSPTLSNEPISSLGEAPENRTPSDTDVASSHFYSQYYYLGF